MSRVTGLDRSVDGVAPAAWRKRARPVVLLGGLALTGVAAWFAPDPGAESVLVVERKATASTNRVAQPAERPAPAGRLIERQPRDGLVGEDALFGVQGATPVATATVAPAQPLAAVAPPSAEPPVPQAAVRLIGRYVDSAGTAAFVTYQEQNLVLRVGDTLADAFRVEQIDDSAMTLRHAASGHLQIVRLDSTP